LAIIKLFFIFVENLKNYGPNVPNELGKNGQMKFGQSMVGKTEHIREMCNSVM
jgi:hypothetical protein